MVDDTDPSKKLSNHNVVGRNLRGGRKITHRHGNSHFTFRDSIHWTTEKGRFKNDIAGDAGLRLDVLRAKIDLAWQEQEIIVGQTTVNGGVHKVLDGESIIAGVGFEVFEGDGGVECHISGQILPGL